MAIGSEFERKVKTSITDLEYKPKSNLVYNEMNVEERIQKQKSEFLTMLTTQLKNQDPFQPMDTSTMTQQIFAMNGVEQQLETNKHLDSIYKLLEDNHMNNSISYIGKTGFFEGNSFIVSNPNDPSVLKYDVEGEAESAKIRIFDMKKNEVNSEVVKVQKGKNAYIWKPDPRTPLGLYKYLVELEHADDKKPATATTFGFGKIDAITTEKGKYTFEVNGEQVEPEKFTQIVDNS